ncbi:TRAP transporter, DctQ-like membrane protein [uncultured Alphaproteobacteria bacterium]|uniref:TRAP transporter small permease protein n=1 Tax=uncultured Alphaproteobacteria bacterium TaxID=91750 RepID=A0A212KMD6_9PROT|nr:TRAP transporter, DctQ-like membrane protein [uncultured Alphaproteobacteria bacterium]
MKIIKFLDDYFEMYVCIALMSAMTLILAVQVFMRYVMQASLTWSEELARYIFVWLIYMGISYGAKIMKHIRIEAAVLLLPEKGQRYVEIVGDVLFLAFACFIVYTSWGIVQKQLLLGQTSPAIQMPMWMLYSAPLVGFGLTALRQIQAIAYRVRLLAKET